MLPERSQWIAVSSDGYNILTGVLPYGGGGDTEGGLGLGLESNRDWLQFVVPEAVCHHNLSFLPKQFWRSYKLLSEATRRLRSRTPKINLCLYSSQQRDSQSSRRNDNNGSKGCAGSGDYGNDAGQLEEGLDDPRRPRGSAEKGNIVRERSSEPVVKCSMMENGPFPDFLARWSDGCVLRYSLGASSARDPASKPTLDISLANGQNFHWNSDMGASMILTEQRNKVGTSACAEEDEVGTNKAERSEKRRQKKQQQTEQHRPEQQQQQRVKKSHKKTEERHGRKRQWPRQVPDQVTEHISLAQQALEYCLALERRALRISDDDNCQQERETPATPSGGYYSGRPSSRGTSSGVDGQKSGLQDQQRRHRRSSLFPVTAHEMFQTVAQGNAAVAAAATARKSWGF
jgi:hypothetical protein